MTQYEDAPGYMHYEGRRFICPCGVSEFKVEVGPEPMRFWCECGAMYTEDLVIAMCEERDEILGGE